MAYKDFNAGFGLSDHQTNDPAIRLHADGQQNVQLPDSSYITDADFSRDGMDLVLQGPHGTVNVEGYFSAETSPTLSAGGHTELSPELVNSFLKASPEFASSTSMNDESPVGAVHEMSGDATVIRTDGTTETLHMGSPIYQGDIIETGEHGAVNIVFTDETSFAVSEDARLAIDDYVYDPGTDAGVQNFSVLKGLFVFTSGMIGREDPDDVHINTPVGSIGIRGTIIAGDVDSGQITVVEGAIVLQDLNGNEMTLASQFETATFTADNGIVNNGQLSAEELSGSFDSIAQVSPNLFSSINDVASESPTEEANPDGSIDQNSDNDVDGSVQQQLDENTVEEGSESVSDEAVEEAAPEDAVQDGGEDAQPTQQQTTTESDSNLGDSGNDFGTDNTSGLNTTNTTTAAKTTTTTTTSTTTAKASGSTGTSTSTSTSSGSTTNTDSSFTGNTTNTVNRGAAPVYEGHAIYGSSTGPNAFALDNSGPSFNFFFDQLFADPEGGNMTYSYSLGAGASSYGQNFSIDPNTGELNFDLSAGFLSGATVGTDGSFTVTVTATDAQGNATSHDFTFDAYETSLLGTTSLNTSGGLHSTNGPPLLNTGTGASSNTIFVNFNGSGSGSSNINLGTNSQSNTIYLQGTGNEVNLSATGAQDNIVFGSTGSDYFVLNDISSNQVYGMMGNDEFKITQAGLNSGSLIDGGGQDANVGHTGDNHGDVLKLSGGGNFDFSGISTQITNIETISAENGVADTISLTLADVMGMSGEDNILIIDMDDGGTDSLAFNAQGSTVTALNNGNTLNIDGEAFYAFDVNGVTIYVDADATNVTGF